MAIVATWDLSVVTGTVQVRAGAVGYHGAVVTGAATVSTEDERLLLERGLTGSPAEVQALVRYLLPVIQVRVGRVLAASGGGGRRNLREEIEDLTQDVFTTLFERDGAVLRCWSPSRGLSLRNFVGMVARRKASAVLAVRKRNPWYEEPMEAEAVERALADVQGAESALAAKELAQEALRRTSEEQSERGKRLLELMIDQGQSNEEVQAETGMSDSAVYQWRSRLTRTLRKHFEAVFHEGGGGS
jgi:RNA polymerase sigma factor (sigma-70 family)